MEIKRKYIFFYNKYINTIIFRMISIYFTPNIAIHVFLKNNVIFLYKNFFRITIFSSISKILNWKFIERESSLYQFSFTQFQSHFPVKSRPIRRSIEHVWTRFKYIQRIVSGYEILFLVLLRVYWHECIR